MSIKIYFHLVLISNTKKLHKFESLYYTLSIKCQLYIHYNVSMVLNFRLTFSKLMRGIAAEVPQLALRHKEIKTDTKAHTRMYTRNKEKY